VVHDCDQSIRPVHGERLEHHGIHDRKNCGGGANAERERED
jgi:hypothetical protein